MTSHASLFDRARRVTPGGVHSPVRAFRDVGGPPLFMARGRGPWIVDVDGREYVDFCMSFGPLILGHADPDVARAAHAAIDDGWSFGTADPYSLDLAEWIASRVPWVERLRFVSSGTEAVMAALRIARAATGRPAVLKFEGCYHGHSDGMLVRAGSGLAGAVAASSAGLPPASLTDTIVAPLDDLGAAERIIDHTGDDLAAVILEPLPANYGLLPQRSEWISGIVDLARRRGALVIFDEVISGFRVGMQGMAGTVGMVPDLVCYGKVIGGGFPVAAYGGRADLLDMVAPSGPVYQAGTLSANPVGMRAGLATLEKVASSDGWTALAARTDAFVETLRERFARGNVPASIVSRASIFWIHAGADPITRPDGIPARHAEWFRRFFHAALARGVYLAPSPFEVSFLSLAHDDAVLAHAAEALGEAAIEAAS